MANYNKFIINEQDKEIFRGWLITLVDGHFADSFITYADNERDAIDNIVDTMKKLDTDTFNFWFNKCLEDEDDYIDGLGNENDGSIRKDCIYIDKLAK